MASSRCTDSVGKLYGFTLLEESDDDIPDNSYDSDDSNAKLNIDIDKFLSSYDSSFHELKIKKLHLYKHHAEPDEFGFTKVDETKNPSNNKNLQHTIGDLHGNAMKLLKFLDEEGFIETDPTTYTRLADIYKHHLTKSQELVQLLKAEVFAERQKIPPERTLGDIFDDVIADVLSKHKPRLEKLLRNIKEFEKIISEMKFNKQGLIRLIGDVLADRGANDIFTIIVIKKLLQENIPIEVIFSNHDLEFFRATTRELLKAKEVPILDDLIKLLDFRLFGEFIASTASYLLLVRGGLLSLDEQFIITDYVKLIKLFSYTLGKDQKQIAIYSHAPIDLEVIKNTAKYFKITYEDETAAHLAQTIDRINQAFHQDFLRNSIYVDTDVNPLADKTDNPICFALWNRDYSILNREQSHEKGYEIIFVHGHDEYGPTDDYTKDLDTQWGKDAKHSLEAEARIYIVSGKSYVKEKKPTVVHAEVAVENTSIFGRYFNFFKENFFAAKNDAELNRGLSANKSM